MKKLEIIGKKYSKLTVLSEYSERTNAGKVQFNCICDCGNKVVVIGSKLINGHTKSCKCLQKIAVIKTGVKNRTHNKSKTPLYAVWSSMKSRCYRKNNDSYSIYGGRGIKVCDRWKHSFDNFLKDMGDRPSINHSIDRIDNDKGYSPYNCRWATQIEQENNKRNNKKYFYNDEFLTLAEISRRLNINRNVLYNRVGRRHQDLEKVIKLYEKK